MSTIDGEIERKLPEMGAQPLLEAIEAQRDDHVVDTSFTERICSWPITSTRGSCRRSVSRGLGPG